MNSDSQQPINLLNLSRSSLLKFVKDCGEPSYRAKQLARWIYQHGVCDFSQMTDISKIFRQQLSSEAVITAPTLIREQQAKDGTCKWLLRLPEGNAIETVFIPERNRGTLCVSSQVGCSLNCSFCATGKEGFNRNLSLAEIIGQLWLAKQQLSKNADFPDRKITNIVMMGMGEPLLNYENVIGAMDWMLCDDAYGLSKYRVTLSTAGVLPNLQKLREDLPVSLAVSLHAPTNALRDQLVPLNKKYPLEQLIPMCRDYFPQLSKRRVVFEYVLLAGVNDRTEDARALIKLLREVPCKINLIPFNAFPGTQYKAPSDARINAFQNHLMDAGFNTLVRRTRGDDIDAACGQLAGQFKDRTGRNARWLRQNGSEVIS